MFKNYVKTALRNLLKHKLYSAINIAGLAIGLFCFLLIVVFIRYEFSYDDFQPDADRLYRISWRFRDDAGNLNPDGIASTSAVIGPQMKNTFPEVEEFGRMRQFRVLVEGDNLQNYEDKVVLADSSILEMFRFDWLQGDPSSALDAPFKAVITESVARRYFGDENALGKTLLINNAAPFTVTGVIRDLPENTHLDVEFLGSMASGPAMFGEKFLDVDPGGDFSFHTYIKLREGTSIDDIAPQFDELFHQVMGKDWRGEDWSARAGIGYTKVTDIHLRSRDDNELSPPGSMNLIYVFSAIAAGVLLIACINFMNLTTARSIERAKEIGMRKSIGAVRGQLIGQFLTEAVFLSLVAMFAAVVMAELLMPVFSAFTGKNLVLNTFREPLQLMAFAGLGVFIGIVAGSYPAFFLSAYEPSRVLKGEVTRGKAGVLFRNVLVVIQFSVAIILIVATAVIYSQIDYGRNIDTGYDSDQLIIDASPSQGFGQQWETMKRELLAYPGISNVTASSFVPGQEVDFGYSVQKVDEPGQSMNINYMLVDYGFFDTYGIGVLAGRTFSEDIPTDRIRPAGEGGAARGAYVLNAEAVRQLGWTPEEALGKEIEFGFNGPRGPVIGVVETVYYKSLRTPQRARVYFLGDPLSRAGAFSFRRATLKLTGDNLQDTLAFIDNTWSRFVPGEPVTRHFLEADMAGLYQTEEKQGQLLTWFSMLSVFIACMGLYGLAAFNVARRTKEIGIRKVMGGSVWGIVLLLTNDFSKLVLVSNVIAWPVAWFAMNRWLENFAYRIDLTPLIFLGSGLIALCIAWVTVGGTAAKAASRKPVLALRYE